MADEIVTEEQSSNSRKTLIYIIIGVIAAIIVVIGIVIATMFFTGVFDDNEEMADQLNSIDTGEMSAADDGTPQLRTVPDTSRLDTLYHQFAQPFTVNVSGSRKVIQLMATLQTHYDQVVIDNVVKHEMAVRAALLDHLGNVTEDQTDAPSFRTEIGEELAIVINSTLEQLEGFGGIERVLFTEFLMQ
ncbi:MAG: flagellar basal body-associated FliL family protein [Gammaproteobacteria bacterium]|nr:flagellar basal body-associated FliL family protein [Gammaproteobacteria bacterium]